MKRNELIKMLIDKYDVCKVRKTCLKTKVSKVYIKDEHDKWKKQ